MTAATLLLYIAVQGLDTTGRHLVVLGAARLPLIPLVLALAAVAATRLGRAGRALVVVGAAATMVGALALVAIDGWAHDPFAVAGASAPWYAFVIGFGGFAFALGTAMVGTALLRAAGDALVGGAVIVAGLLYVPAIPLGAVGHAVWAVSWLLASSAVIARARRPREVAGTPRSALTGSTGSRRARPPNGHARCRTRWRIGRSRHLLRSLPEDLPPTARRIPCSSVAEGRAHQRTTSRACLLMGL